MIALAACYEDSPDVGGKVSTPAISDDARNSAPTISGRPRDTSTPNKLYEFIPQASDQDGDSLRFEIVGRPSWATFNPNTGRLYGTPTNPGTFGPITISVTDGRAGDALPAFSITVLIGADGGTAKLSWVAPTSNTDGSPVTSLAGFKIYYGQLPDAPTTILQIADPEARSTVVGGLSSGTWYFSISAYTSSGTESARTSTVSKSI
jgi:hypothetical protein